jgi:hypothetical protein
VQAKAKDDPHHRKARGEPSVETVPVVQMDYSFARCDESTTDQIKILSMTDIGTGFAASTVVDVKGPASEFAMAWALRFLRQLGYQKIMLQTDQEQSIMALASKIAENRAQPTMMRQTPRRSHQSNGAVERNHQSLQARREHSRRHCKRKPVRRWRPRMPC